MADVLNSFEDNRIIIITGIRRSGKSTLLRQIMKNKASYCYVSFEDERFIDFKAQDWKNLLMLKVKRLKCFLFGNGC